MSTAVATQPAADPPPPADLAIDTDTGEIGTVAELTAKQGASGEPARAEVVKPGAVETLAKEPAAVTPPPIVDGGEKTKDQLRAEAADRLRARGVARRSRVAEDAQLRGHALTLEQRLQAEATARKAAEDRALAAERQTLPALQARGEAGKALAQAAINESTPEAIARRAMDRAEAADRRIADYEAKEARRIAAEQASAARDRFARYAADARELGDDGKPSDVPAFPHVAAHMTRRREGVMLEADALVRRANERGHRPTWDQVLQYLETEYGEAAKLATGGATPTPIAAPAPAVAPKPAANGARTLTAKTQQRAVAGKRFEDMEVRNIRDGGTDEQLEYIAELARKEAAAGARG